MGDTQGAAGTVTRSAAEIVATAPKIGTATVHIEEWDADIAVRGLGKREQRKINDDATDEQTGKQDPDVVEMSMFLHGVTDPTFTEEQIEALWGTAPGPINRVLLKILELSGAREKAVDTAVKTFPEGPDAPVRARTRTRPRNAARGAAHAA